jgi:hypothetical protein
MATATTVGYLEMRIAKVVGLSGADDEPLHQYVVLEDMSGDRHLPLRSGTRRPSAWQLASMGSPGLAR